MDRRSQKRIMRRRRNQGGIILAIAAALALVITVYAVTANVFAGGTMTAPPQKENTSTHDTGTEDTGMQAETALPEASGGSQQTAEDQTHKSSEPTGSFTGSLAAQSAVLVDGNGTLLYTLDGDAKRYPASTTKVLTALIALEKGTLTDIIRIGNEVNLPKPGSSSAGLRYGEKLSLSDLLNAMLIPSGNDAAYVIATYIGRKVSNNPQMDCEEAVEVFVGLMNSRAHALGAVNSHFANPDGFHDEEHYTTAKDMALIAREAMSHREFRNIVVKTQFKLPDVKVKDKNGNQKTQQRILVNTNELLDSSNPCFMQNCSGIKTGHTSEAGYCLISSVTKGGKTVLAVVLDSTADLVWQDSSSLLQWGLLQE